MKQLVGWLSFGFAAALALSGCSNATGDASEDANETGTLALPLVTNGPSGATYRLQDATFQIVPYQYYWESYYGSGGGGWGTGSTYTTRPTITVKTDNDSNEETLQLDLEQGEYYVRLLPGWHLAKLDGNKATTVEAQLLSGETQWAWVYTRSTSFVEYEFGIGGRSVWFNGKLNVNIVVRETPEELYGGAGGAYTGSSYRSSSYGSSYTTGTTVRGSGGAAGISE